MENGFGEEGDGRLGSEYGEGLEREGLMGWGYWVVDGEEEGGGFGGRGEGVRGVELGDGYRVRERGGGDG